MKKGIIQSRGLGDIVIALPIARHYFDRGETIVWPICEEFYPSVRTSVPWVAWRPVATDAAGGFFLEGPREILAEEGVLEEDILYLYQYLNSRPDLTDPELFNILKFDQYKYAVAGVPFRDKWRLAECITRDRMREHALRDCVSPKGAYAVVNLKGSNFTADIDLGFLDPAVDIIRMEDWATDCVFDWLTLLEGAAAIVCVDSAVANIVDQLMITGPELWWIRRSSWDLTPVMGSSWRIVPSDLPIVEPCRVDPAAEAARRRPPASDTGTPGLTSHVPFEADRSKYPTSFMSALRK